MFIFFFFFISMQIYRDIRCQFNINFFLIGTLNYIEFQLQRDLRSYYEHFGFPTPNSASAVNAANFNKIATQQKQQKCYECNVAATNSLCIQCNVFYCVFCFEKVHSLGKSFRLHKLRQVNTTTKNYNFEVIDEVRICTKHIDGELNYYCVDCELKICELCKLDHDDHTLSNIFLEVSSKLFKKHV